MPEHQTIEYKESGHDEFLEGICAMQTHMVEHFISEK